MIIFSLLLSMWILCRILTEFYKFFKRKFLFCWKSFAYDFNDFYVNHYLKMFDSFMIREESCIKCEWFKASEKVHLALIQQQQPIDSNDINITARKCFIRSRFAAIASLDDLCHH